MFVNNPNITDKKYNRLVLEIGLTGFSYCIFDSLNQQIISFQEVQFPVSDVAEKTEDLYASAYESRPELREGYDEILVLQNNSLSTFVPTALFDEEYLGSYLQYNTKVFATDFFAFDEIESFQMNTVYIPYVNINNFLVDQYGSFQYKHTNSILVAKLLESTKNIDETKVFVYVQSERFDLLVLSNQKLLLSNTFDYKTPEDLIYYLLFTAEQLNLNPEHFKLEFLGDITETDANYKIAYQYIRHVGMMDLSGFKTNNTFSTADNLKHFILFQSWESYPVNLKEDASLLQKTFPFALPPTWAKKLYSMF